MFESPAAAFPSAQELADLVASPIGSDGPPSPHSAAAAVLIPLFDHGGVPHTLLTKRSAHLLHHPGQVSFPGGRFELADESLATTALRETEEEVGIRADQVTIVRRLGPVNTRVSGFLVTPFVGLVEGELALRPESGEIDRILTVPLAHVLAADALLPAFPTIATLRYPLDGEDVWGATARILSDFVRCVRRSVPQLP